MPNFTKSEKSLVKSLKDSVVENFENLSVPPEIIKMLVSVLDTQINEFKVLGKEIEAFGIAPAVQTLNHTSITYDVMVDGQLYEGNSLGFYVQSLPENKPTIH